MAEQEQNRTEPATPFKLREARRKGQVAKSLELNSFVAILTFLGVMVIWGKAIFVRLLQIMQEMLGHAHQVNFEIEHVFSYVGTLLVDLGTLFAPLFAVLIAVVALTNVLQTGPVFSFFPLKPDLQRLNPVAGFKRVFSSRLLIEALKSTLKILLFGFVIYFLLKALMPRLFGMMQSDPDFYAIDVSAYSSELIFKLAMVLFLVALIDLLYTRWHFADKMKMSHREVKEEVKRREGDPQIRAKIKQLQKEMLKRSKSVKRVPEADVLITNPTHVAIAVRYRRESMQAPQVIAKGVGEMAQHMKAMARLHRIPTVEDKPLARGLYRHVEVDQFIPESFYGPVAAILARVYARHGNPTLTVEHA
jgi:flagellar biosynthetic protein FlhB